MTVAPSRPEPSSPAAGPATAYDRSDWASAFRNVGSELTAVGLEASSGTIPAQLKGTLYRNGPGRLERGGRWVHHPFDGDGMITALRFEAGQARLTNRFVRTEGWQAEEAAGKFTYRGVFGTQKPGGLAANAFDLRLKNIANTHVVRLGDKLLALWEASSPHSLDPESLETTGIDLLDGNLAPAEAFSAHPRFDPGHHGRRRMVSFGVKAGPRSTIRLMEFGADGADAGALLTDQKHSFGGFAFLHDFAITPHWAVFLQNAMSFNPLGFVFGLKGAAQCLDSKPGVPGEFWLLPRSGDGKPLQVAAPEGFVFHHLNAWEEPDQGAAGTVVVDSIFYADFPSIGPDVDFRAVDFASLPIGQLKRCRIDLAAGTVSTELLEERCCEFATVNPARVGLRARYAWMAVTEQESGNAPLQAIEKLDLESGERLLWSAAPRGFVSEPVMVPRAEGSEEDDGWLLVVVWNGARCSSDLVILRAGDLSEQAVLPLPLAIPHGLHGSWAEAS
ncbi:carotenoid oxygenase family protein [Synechococcus sp. CS-1324]|uniref:carotenoid oxygenase family protein n=1 Tax=unclassified Synechococcus TaxID=2626047 RepID=UPI000DB7A488|nr:MULTISPECIES: carotenoid oxygenase family protein [unclassified Synechococcus]MCT0212374.1 carotenoid oxygenase family protein [Synechococcus sp. CS-1326]MCT0231257.1 carotenoid oxygenase family protein [Synechococcus sp. CS-1324]MCT0234557.1 carotenoid oxygenase family protein [Synechococcus sp. CS-1327]PZV03853.1 MAG: Apocarotenoid-15,15'-oxygenase [Cyanobium sp.]